MSTPALNLGDLESLAKNKVALKGIKVLLESLRIKATNGNSAEHLAIESDRLISRCLDQLNRWSVGSEKKTSRLGAWLFTYRFVTILLLNKTKSIHLARIASGLVMSGAIVVGAAKAVQKPFLGDSCVKFQRRMHLLGYILPRDTRERVWFLSIEELARDWREAKREHPSVAAGVFLKCVFWIRALGILLDCFRVYLTWACVAWLAWGVRSLCKWFVRSGDPS